MPWVFRGLRNGILTTRWPKRADSYFDSFPAAVSVLDDPKAATSDTVTQAAAACPTGAISAEAWPRLDRGRCILCGRCVEACTRLVRLAIRFGDSTAEPQRRGGRRS